MTLNRSNVESGQVLATAHGLLGSRRRRDEAWTGLLEETAHRPRSVLVVEDDHEYASLVRSMLERASHGEFETTHVDCLAGAHARLLDSPPDCVLLDLSLPDARGLKALDDLRALAPEIPLSS